MKHKKNNKITDLLALLVFGIFALCVATVLLTGARVYKNLTDRGNLAHDHRVAARYLTTRFHQAQRVQVEEFDGVEALILHEEIGGRTYLTRVYCCDGHIRELFAAGSADLSPTDGEIVMEAENLAFEMGEDILTVEITHPDGKMQRLLLALPEWKEAPQ